MLKCITFRYLAEKPSFYATFGKTRPRVSNRTRRNEEGEGQLALWNGRKKCSPKWEVMSAGTTVGKKVSIP